MKFNRKVRSLELKNISAIGLEKLDASKFARFTALAKRSGYFADFDALSANQLEEYLLLCQLTNPNSKVKAIDFDSVSLEQLEAYAAKLKELKGREKNEVRQEIELENTRRKFALNSTR